MEIFIDDFCKKNNLDVFKIKSSYKKEPYASYRKIIIFILRNKHNMKLIDIAKVMNKKDHSAISNSIAAHARLYKFNKEYRNRYLESI